MYNLMYSIVFFCVPLFCFVFITIRILTKTHHADYIKQLLSIGFGDFNTYKIPFQYIDFIDQMIILCFISLFCIGYTIITKQILEKLFFTKYKNILIITNIKKISWISVIFFVVTNSVLSFIGALLALFWIKYINFNYKILFFLAQVVGFFISWIFTYYLLNKFVEHFAQCKIKPLGYKY